MRRASAFVPGQPVVSVGIPTFERADKLRRAVESVLCQTHANLEVVISDNASRDGTQEVCRELCERDPRVEYVRSAANAGPTANFNAVFERLRGDYVMVLSDDDWLDSDYVERCLAALSADPSLVLVCGIARYVRGREVVRRGSEIQLRDASPHRRVRSYMRSVDENGLFYGLMRRSTLDRARPLRNVMGNDWLLVAAILAQGPAETLLTSSVNRELGGTSDDFAKLCRTLSLPRWQARLPHLVIAWNVLADIGWRSAAHRAASPVVRLPFALAAAWATIRWRSLAWHLTMPTFAALGRRRGGAWIWRGYVCAAGLAGRRARR